MEKNVVLLTSNFPFGKGEEFLETELDYLINGFDKLVIIASNRKDNKTREIPSGVLYLRFEKYAPAFFSKTSFTAFFQELKYIKKRKLLNKRVVRLVIVYFINASIKARKIEKTLKKQNLNLENTIIYSYWANNNLLAALFLKSKFPTLKIITRAHGGDLYLERHIDHYIPFRKFIYNHIDNIFTISGQGKSYLQLHYPNLLPSQISVSRLGVKKINNSNVNFNNLSKKDELFIVSCSYLSPVKRINLLIKELSLITDIKIKWRHIGGGILLEEMKKLADNLIGSKENIDYSFLGHKKNNEVYQFYSDNDIDIFISVSESEGIPVSFMEAQLFGIPIIATNVGGVSEIVNNENGYLIDKDFKEGTIKGCLEDYLGKESNQKKDLRENAFDSWREKYNADQNYSYFVNILKKL